MTFLNKKSNLKWDAILSIVMCFILLTTAFVSIFYQEASATEKKLTSEIDIVQNNLNSVQEDLTKAQLELQEKEALIKNLEKQLQNIQQDVYHKDTQIENLQSEIEQNKIDIEMLNKNIQDLKDSLFSPTNDYGVVITDYEVELIAKTLWGEARGMDHFERSMVVWCILNRVDNAKSTIAEVVLAPDQFHGYHPDNPVWDDLVALTKDVLARWQLEKMCSGEVGRTLPSDYLWFRCKDKHNVFRNQYSGDYDIWEWSNCWNPYENWK